MRKSVLLYLFLFFSIISVGQQFENSNWCFGTNARLEFSSVPPTSTSCQINLPLPTGGPDVASVSDNNGQLLFYTNGRLVWGRNHAIMPNGSQIYGSTSANFAKQYLAIVPKPSYAGIYYLFTTSNGFNNNPPSGHEGIYYSVIDMSLNNGNGDVITGLKNIPLKNQNGIPIDYDYNSSSGLKIEHSKVSTTLNQSEDKVWVSFFCRFDNGGTPERFLYSYLVSERGIDGQPDGSSPLPTSTTIINNSNYPGAVQLDWLGSIKFSPDHLYMCDAAYDAVNLYNFNDQTGQITFDRTVYSGSLTDFSGQGVEFSPNSQLLYFTTFNNLINQDNKGESQSDSQYIFIHQYRIGTNKIGIIGRFPVGSNSPTDAITPIAAREPYALQLANDNKIYVCVSNVIQGPYYGWLGAIRQPDLVSTACDFNPNEIQLATGTNHWGSLPQWVHVAKSYWPKVYQMGVKGEGNLLTDRNGNIFYSFNTTDFNNNYNHIGAISPVSNSVFLAHYNAAGISSWVKPDVGLLNISHLNNGDLRLVPNQTAPIFGHFSAVTGNPVTPPSILPTNVMFISETNSGSYISSSNGFSSLEMLYVHYPGGINQVSNCVPDLTIFNETSEKLFLSVSRLSNGSNRKRFFEVYSHSNNFLTLNSSTEQLPVNIDHVDNQDRLYAIDNGQLMEYNYLSVPNVLTPVSISGFNNNNIVSCHIPNLGGSTLKTADRLVVYNTADEKIYILDFNLQSARNISVTNFIPTGTTISNYAFDGDFLYLSGTIDNNSTYITIGNQIITPVYTSSGYNSNFITRLNASRDFSMRFAKPVSPLLNITEVRVPELKIFPVPASGNIKIVLDKSKITGKCMVDILDRAGNSLMRYPNYLTGQDLDISSLKNGVYYVQLKTEWGEYFFKTFSKL